MASYHSLPLETLQHICDYLASDHKPSLYVFALVSKRCSLATNIQRFRDVHFVIRDAAKLSEDLNRANEILRRSSTLGCVRRLEIRGYLLVVGEENASLYVAKTREQLRKYAAKSDNDIEDDLPSFYGRNISFTDTLEITNKLDKAWKPLANFLTQLKGLSDLVYACDNQFPSCLLEVLHQYLLPCRLHIYGFRLESLVQDLKWPQDVDPYEYRLATSPCLYSIVVPHSLYTSYGLVDYNDMAVLRMSSGLAPNLKRVHFAHHRWFRSKRSSNRPRQELWGGFFPNHSPCPSNLGCYKSTGKLYSLGFSDYAFVLEEWDDCIAFSSLRVLHLNTEIGLDLLKRASDCKFSSLETLVLHAGAEHPREEHKLMDEAVANFLQSLRPLKALKLTGFFGLRSFQATLEYHSSLHHVWLSTTQVAELDPFDLTAEKTRELSSHCPGLTKVALKIRRTQGDMQELSIYRTLGSLPVEDLFLHLDCSEFRGSNISSHADSDLASDSNSDWDLRPVKTTQIRNTMINYAVDESLARSIFQEISRAQSKEGKASLRRLRLKVIQPEEGWYDPDLSHFADIINVIGRSWECISSPAQGDKCPPDLIVREYGPQAFRHRSQCHKFYEEYEMTLPQQIFRELWPSVAGIWHQEWHSFPLVSD